jgi:hypothetical protein
MPPLPMTVTPDRVYAFYLHPKGSAGTEAICYLPAFNHWMRDRLTSRGFRLISQITGDFSEGNSSQGGSLRVEPPSDDVVRAMIAELESRIEADGERLQGEIAQTKERMEDTEAKERGIYRQRLKQLEREWKSLGKHIPTFEQAKVFFVRVHRAQLRAKINPAIVAQQLVMAEEQQWAGVEALLRKDMDTVAV